MSSGGWKTTTLGVIAEIVMGQSPSGDTCNAIGDGTPLLNGPTEFGSNNPCPIQFTTDPKKISEEGDLLFCVRGSTTGRMNWADQKYAIGRGLAVLRHRSGYSFQPFLKGIIDSYLSLLLAEATGSTFPNVSSQQLNNLTIEVPDLRTQRRIAAILSALDEKIELNRQINAALEAIAQEIFKEWFVDFRFPGSTGEMQCVGVGSEPAPTGPIPKNWQVGRLGDLVNISSGKGLKKDQFKDNGFPVLGANGRIGFSDDFLFDEELILTGRVGTLGTFQLVSGKVWISDNVLILKPIKNENYHYAYFLLKTINFENLNRGSTQPLVTKTDLVNQTSLIPSNELLDRFNLICRSLFSGVSISNQQIATLVNIRENLLPKLMSGEIEV